MNLKFLCPGTLEHKIYINPNYFYLKLHYQIFGKNFNKINWLMPLYEYINDTTALVKHLLKEKVDILCLSFFQWNRETLEEIGKQVKRLNPNIIIIAGGPDLDAQKNQNFFSEFFYIDYVIYGDGELALTQLLDSIIGKFQLSDDSVNIVTKEKKYPHSIFKNKDFFKFSPWLENKEEFKNVHTYLTKKFSNTKIIVTWEIARGCPYNCSFCDWSSGLHNKVTRRKAQWKNEVNYFADIGVKYMRISDANWGQWDEDIEINQYVIDKEINFQSENLSKLKKDNAYKILQQNYNNKINKNLLDDDFVRQRISFQDINPMVLNNINRPEIPWDNHKKIIKNFLNRNPNALLTAELIVGLPGQTIDTWIETLLECEDAGFKKIDHNFWHKLVNSPADKQEYQEKHGLYYDNFIYLVKTFNSEQELNQTLKFKNAGYYKADIFIKTNTATTTDQIFMHICAMMYNRIKSINLNNTNFESFYKKYYNSMMNAAIEQSDFIINNKIIGFRFDDKFYPIESFWSSLNGLRKITKS